MRQIKLKNAKVPTVGLILLGQLLLPGCQVGLSAGNLPTQPSPAPSTAPSATPSTQPSTTPSALPDLELEVNSQRVACTGVAPMQCLQTRKPGATAWENWYDQIEGFTYEAGTSYTILIAQEAVANPPQDASNRRYRLIRILKQTKAG